MPKERGTPKRYRLDEEAQRSLLVGLYFRSLGHRWVAVYSPEELRDLTRVRRDAEGILSSWSERR